jgi:hypothetical protein
LPTVLRCAVMNTLLAVISGQQLINLVIWLIVAAVIFWLVNWLIDYIGIQEPFNKIIKVILAIFCVLICINALLALGGHPLVSWP